MKTEAKAVGHTAGPWKHDEVWGLIMGTQGEEIAAVHSGVNETQMGRQQRFIAEANAQLIAAAPELLEACKALVLLAHHSASAGLTLREIFGTGNCVEQPIGTEIKSAIAKAEGRQ